MSLQHVAETAIRRSNQVYFEQVASRETIDLGYAYTNAAFPSLAECNFLGEVLLDEDRASAFDRVERWFAERGATCQRWVPCAEQNPDEVEAVVAPRGMVRRTTRVYAFEALDAPPPAEELRVLSGRAMRRAYQSLVAERAAEVGGPADSRAQMHAERLDDPQYEPLVALLDERPAGIAALFQVGPIGRICDVWVAPAARRRGVARGLVTHAVRTAVRWALRPLCAASAEDDAAGRGLLAATGFTEFGTMTHFERPGAVVVGG